MSAASDIGEGRPLPGRKAVCLDRRTPEGWVEIARYGDSSAAAAALDHAVAETGYPEEFRLRGSTAGRLPVRLGLVVVAVGAVVFVLAWIAIR